MSNAKPLDKINDLLISLAADAADTNRELCNAWNELAEHLMNQHGGLKQMAKSDPALLDLMHKVNNSLSNERLDDLL